MRVLEPRGGAEEGRGSGDDGGFRWAQGFWMPRPTVGMREAERQDPEPDLQAPQDCVATRRGKDPRGPQSDSCFLGVTQKAPMACSRCRAAKGTHGMHSPTPCPGVTLRSRAGSRRKMGYTYPPPVHCGAGKERERKREVVRLGSAWTCAS